MLPNAWDAGSARILEHAGFPVIATTSAGISFAAGRPDGTLTRSAMLAAVASIVDSASCPVTADLEAGYGETAAEVAATITEAVSIGVVGANIEDRDARSGDLLDPDEAADRLAAARSVVPVGQFVINARVDSYLARPASSQPDAVFDDTVERANRYVAAGADCIFVPGVGQEHVAALVDAIDAPLNVVAGLNEEATDAMSLRALGVARISIGGSLARAALAFTERAARDMLERDSFGHTRDALSHGELQRRFADRPA